MRGLSRGKRCHCLLAHITLCVPHVVYRTGHTYRGSLNGHVPNSLTGEASYGPVMLLIMLLAGKHDVSTHYRVRVCQRDDRHSQDFTSHPIPGLDC